MNRLTATAVARDFSAVINRVSGGEKVEVLRNGLPVVRMTPVGSGHSISAERWKGLMEEIPSVDEEFANDVEAGRRSIGPPSGTWPS